MRRLVSTVALVILAVAIPAATQTNSSKPASSATGDRNAKHDSGKHVEKNPPNPASVPAGTISSRRSCCRLCRTCAPNDPGAPNATALVIQSPAEKPEDERDSLLKASIPFLQSLLWVLLIGVVLIAWRSELVGLVQGRHFRLKILDFEIEIFAAEQATGTEDLPVEEVPFR